ncbi:MAG: BsaWI family type II restriction enzyme [Verrucomicrobiota bacterium]|jgi:BsaWI restriction endonuclease type 2
MTDNRIAQAARTQAGNNLESVVARILNPLLNEHKIFVIKGSRKELSRVLQDAGLVDQIIEYSTLPVKRPCDQNQIKDYPDTDLYVIYKDDTKWRVLGIISCKVSFHARHTEVAFWGLAIRTSSNMKYVCVTEDADTCSGKKSELGVSCTDSKAARRILESYTTRVYICKKYKSKEDPQLDKDVEQFRKLLPKATSAERTTNPCFDNPQSPNHTQYCASVRPLDELYFDALRWLNEAFPL